VGGLNPRNINELSQTSLRLQGPVNIRFQFQFLIQET